MRDLRAVKSRPTRCGTVRNFRRLDPMNDRVETCRRKAADCTRAAILATDKDTRLMLLDLAKQWREMAEQAEELEKRYNN
jgi:hypothetical protein